MKISKIVNTSAVFAALLIGAAGCFGQKTGIAGGYYSVAANDSAVVEAANFAVSERRKVTGDKTLKFIAVEKAKAQVVAGMNYELCLTVNAYSIDVEATAVIFRDLSGKHSLTSWRDGRCGDENADDETVSYKGSLETGEKESSILYFGTESGDYAAFCFTNNSAVGKAILQKCKKGAQCEFVGKVNWEKPCKVPRLKADLSASGQIISIDSVRSVPSEAPRIDPAALVKKLYASEAAGRSPFFQSSDRALLDEYFSADLADLLWEDAVSSNGEVGALSFDPLFNAQDTKITNFVIGKTQMDKVSGAVAVIVTFKNFGKAEKFTFHFQLDPNNNWKITDITYKKNSSLKSIFLDAAIDSEPAK